MAAAARRHESAADPAVFRKRRGLLTANRKQLEEVLASRQPQRIDETVRTALTAYSNHHTQVEEQLARSPFAYPTLHIKRRPVTLFDYEYEDFEVEGYNCHPAIKAPVAV